MSMNNAADVFAQTTQEKENVAVVCSTYRNPDKASLSRLYGPVHLLEEMKSKNYNVSVTLVDSSPKPHPFFAALDDEQLKEKNVIYLHVPDRNISRQWLDQRYQETHKFIPTDVELENEEWKKRSESLKAWEAFIPFEESFREIYKGPKVGDFLFMPRPAIGMKRNLGVYVTQEEQGETDYICFADDDDHHAEGYIDAAVEGLKNSDFARMTNWLTYDYGPAQDDAWGQFNVPFRKDANGTWSVPQEHKDKPLLSGMDTEDGKYSNTVKDKFSPLLCLAFPPLGHDGALHSYTYKAWKRSVDAFGGWPASSFSEDMLYYSQNEKTFGKDFKVTAVETEKPLFLRCSDGTNASIVEWTDTVAQKEVPDWARRAQTIRKNALSITEPEQHDEICRSMAENFAKTGNIAWPEKFLDVGKLTPAP